LSGGRGRGRGCGVGDREPDGPVAEVGDEVQAPAESLDRAGDDVEGRDLAVLDLGDPGDAHPKRRGDVLLAAAELLTGLGELVTAVLGEQLARSRRDLLRRDASRVEFFVPAVPSPAGSALPRPVLSLSGVVNVKLFSQRGCCPGSSAPTCRLVTTQQR